MSSELEVSFRFVHIPSYRKVDIKIYSLQDNYHTFFSFNHKFLTRKGNVSGDFFYMPKTYVIIDSY